MKNFNPKAFCKDCIKKRQSGSRSCPVAERYMCSDYQAYLASEALSNKEAALQIPIDLMLTALRLHGYTGELRKIGVVTI